MVLPYQADHIIIQLVLFEHGDGKIRLFHCHVEPGDGRYTWDLLHPDSCSHSHSREIPSLPSRQRTFFLRLLPPCSPEASLHIPSGAAAHLSASRYLPCFSIS